ncbi:gas vesicle protein [Hyalangium rubrum]|uniref:Gas vesicle protein n=1 Tax=Hyalangium rubrum TaxID=3103134 RepID=A0ABU5HLX3_9BACT|nr:gas vesicle protein [Hyalangium sp. s54d21]MDY7233110.1 gas vesicle protein [Hyalangium sp. s54d21]
MTTQRIVQGPRGATLADVLDRVLDKGLVVAGDIKIKLLDVELLTIQVRLVVCSVEKAAEMGMDFWRSDPHLSPRPQPEALAPEALTRRVAELEAVVAKLERASDAP